MLGWVNFARRLWPKVGQFWTPINKAVRLFYKENKIRQYIEAYQRIFKDSVKKRELSLIEILTDDFPSLLASMPTEHAFEATVYHARLTFDKLPKALVRHVYLKIMSNAITLFKNGSDKRTKLRAALALTMSLPKDTVQLNDIIEIGERGTLYNSDLVFRARSDGAAHWAINPHFGRPLIVTISQLDDRPDVSLVTLCLALALLAFSDEISEDVLAGLIPPRDEANIQVVNYSEAKELVPFERAGLYSMENACEVMRATDSKGDPGTPIFLITRDDIIADWVVGEGKGNSGQLLFAKVLVELIYHLFAGEIELDSLYPKVISLIKQTII